MSKYEPLRKYLHQLKKSSWKASFTDIEKILGFSLPESAHHHQAWWANDRNHTHAKPWLDAGWLTGELNFANTTITFRRESDLLKASRKKSEQKPRQHSEKTQAVYSWDECRTQQCSLAMEWRSLGRILMDEQPRLIFPKVADVPAIYRFRLRQGKKESLYIGETDNLRRRFGNYRNPGPTQQTSLRINALLKMALKNGAEISVSAIMSGAWVDLGAGRKPADLSSKIVRGLFENAAMLACGGIEIEMLNRAK